MGYKLLCTGVPELLKLISNVLEFPAKLTQYLWQLLHKRSINTVLYVVCKGPKQDRNHFPIQAHLHSSGVEHFHRPWREQLTVLLAAIMFLPEGFDVFFVLGRRSPAEERLPLQSPHEMGSLFGRFRETSAWRGESKRPVPKSLSQNQHLYQPITMSLAPHRLFSKFDSCLPSHTCETLCAWCQLQWRAQLQEKWSIFWMTLMRVHTCRRRSAHNNTYRSMA